jgi:cytochrome d ubiquinol oxidase subunit II
VALEFRFKAHRGKLIWDVAFAAGSTVAAFCQGLVLGTFILGYQPQGQSVINAYHWITPFSVMTGVAVVFGYALLGCTWLIAKTVGDLQKRLYQLAQWLLLSVAMFMVIVSIWTPLASEAIWQRWFVAPGLFKLAPLPIITLLVFIWNWLAIKVRAEVMPFVLSILLFVLAYIGFCISDFPYIVPRLITIWEASSPLSSQLFLLVGACLLLPVLIGYTIYSYKTFRGKVTSAEHHY